MASGPLLDGGQDVSREKRRWVESKVYTRKIHRIAKPDQNPVILPVSQPRPSSSPQTLAVATDGIDSSLQQLQPPAPLEQVCPSIPHQPSAVSEDDASSLDPQPVGDHNHPNRQNRVITIDIASKEKREIRELHRRLTSELEMVRSLVRRLEAQQKQSSVMDAVKISSPRGHTLAQLSENEVAVSVPIKKVPTISETAPVTAHTQVFHHLTVSVPSLMGRGNDISDIMEKEKRTPKANQYYKNTDFLLGKERLPSHDSNKKSKAHGIKNGMLSAEKKINEQAFKKCEVLLSRLMKHCHGWVFNTPVDAKALGLPDYHKIITKPMDLGTVKYRLNKNWYKAPKEFAEDVRLTFHNAMTYNPKGQDVHVMAHQLLQIFEERWLVVEAELAYLHSPPSLKRPPPFHSKRNLDMSAINHLGVDFKTKSMNRLTHVGRPPALQKPKAKDPNKREMTFEEKQKLSNNLQNLPMEKLDMVVEIIRRRNLSLSQHEDEIEVDIDCVDTETLWELDRFVTNYKKGLSKSKRRAELAILSKAGLVQHGQNREQGMVTDSVPPDLLKENQTESAENIRASSLPVGGTRVGQNGSTSSSSSSSSDSGSSSSDSDSESSSGCGSDGIQSPGT